MAAAQSTYERVNEGVQQAAETSKEFVSDHAISSTMAAFGFGLATGIALVYMLSDSSESKVEEEVSVAQRIGKQIMDAVSDMIPQSMAKYTR